MAGRSRTQPLFDLVRRRGDVNTPPETRSNMNPGVGWRPGMAPPPTPHSPAQSERPSRPVIASTPSREGPNEAPPPPAWYRTLLGESAVRVPVNAFYLATAAIIALIFLSFVAYSHFSGNAQSQDSTRQPPPVREPSDTPPTIAAAKPTPSRATSPDIAAVHPSAPASVPKTANKSPEPAKSAPGRSPGAPTASPQGAVALGPTGFLAADPREPGLNYLRLADLPQTECENAIKFMVENGFEAFAIPVDPGRWADNNSDPTKTLCKLYASRGITTDEYSKKMTARTNTEAAAARLGARWQKEFKGSSNFAKPGWEKFK